MKVKTSIVILLALTACTPPRQTVIEQVNRFRQICHTKALNGYIKTAVDLVECESKHVLATSISSGFSDDEALTAYYAEKLTLAQQIDDKKIGRQQAIDKELQIESRYAGLFNSQNDGATVRSAIPSEDFINRAMVNYAIFK